MRGHAEADPGRRLPNAEQPPTFVTRVQKRRLLHHKKIPRLQKSLQVERNYTKMAERLQQFLSHLKPGSAPLAALSQKNPDDVVVTLAVRTPLTKAKKGGLRDTTLEHMLLRLYQVL